MRKVKEITKKVCKKLYKISTSKTAYSFITLSVACISLFCIYDVWLDNRIVDKREEIRSIIE